MHANGSGRWRGAAQLGALAVGLVAVASCADEGATPLGGGAVAISVAPLDLAQVTSAQYTLTVTNLDGEVVWTRAVDSTAFGDGAGSISYVGPCDAASNPNTVAVVLDALSDPSGPLVEGVDYVNPAPASQPVTRTVTCLADRDVSVTFDITVARVAEQGFFDIALEFRDVFCSAKLDCVSSEGGPLELLLNPLTRARDLTAVAGFACTSGAGGTDTVLAMDLFRIDCDGGGPFFVDPSAGPGNLNPPFPGPAPNTSDLLFQASVFRGAESLPGYVKGYWNVAFGLNADAFSTLGACTLTGAATATEEALIDGLTPTLWPYVVWNVPLTNATGDFVCGSNPLGAGTAVTITQAPEGGRPFLASFAPSIDALSPPPVVYVERGYNPSVSHHDACVTPDSTAPPHCLLPGYNYEGSQWKLSPQPIAGTVPVYGCQRTGNRFLSVDPACDGLGTIDAGVVGYIFEHPVDGLTTTDPLRTCRLNLNPGDYFHSLVTNCEGYPNVAVLGYPLQ